MSVPQVDGWLSLAISDIAVFGSGDLISVARLSARSGAHPVPVYGGNGIAGYTSLAMVDQPTVILGRVGQKCGAVYRNAGPAWVTDNALYARRFKRLLDVQFFAFALEAARLNDVKNRNDLPLITQSILNDVKIAWPDDLEEQRQIAGVITDVDDLIASLERMIAKNQAIKKGLIQQLLADQARLSGWPRLRLSDLIDGLEAGVSVRSSEYASHGLAVLKTSAVNNGRFDPAEAKPVFPADIRRVRCNPVAGSLIISRMNTPALVGEVGYVEHNYVNLYLPDRLWLARPKPGGRQKINMRWLGYYLTSESGSRAVRELATGTSGSMKNIPKDRLLALDVPTPPPHEQDRIAEMVRDVDRVIDLFCDRLSKAQDIKQGMMQELLTGRTRVSIKEDAA